MIRVEEVSQALEGSEVRFIEDTTLTRAAVALLLHERGDKSHMLLIERARRDGDPWSGQISLPGGMAKDGEDDLERTIEREVQEEIGLDLATAVPIGRLSDLHALTQPLAISTFVYHWPKPESPLLTIGPEVAEAFWVDLDSLYDPARQMRRRMDWQGRKLDLPAIAVLRAGRPVLWGLTYRVLERLFEVIGRPLPQRTDA